MAGYKRKINVSALLLFMMLLVLLGMVWCVFNRQQVVNNLTSSVATSEMKTTHLRAQVEQQAQKIATLDAVVQTQRAEIERDKIKAKVQVLVTQGHALLAEHPLLGLRLLLEA